MAIANLHKLLLPLLVALVIMAVAINADYGEGKPEGGDLAAMADAIKYLQGLDKVYGQAARPRQLGVAFACQLVQSFAASSDRPSSQARGYQCHSKIGQSSVDPFRFLLGDEDFVDGGGETAGPEASPSRFLAGRSTRQAGLGHILGNLLHLNHLDKEYAARIRPRFGKRNFGHRLADKDEAQFLDV